VSTPRSAPCVARVGRHRLSGEALLDELGVPDGLGDSRVSSRFEALCSRETPFIGRDDELELLRRRWRQMKTGEGQVVLVSGEAGIGKSRLVATMIEEIAGEPHTRLRYFCSPHNRDSALYPIIG
jgi:MoxR-like ATPase